jgi:hypothetical protein
LGDQQGGIAPLFLRVENGLLELVLPKKATASAQRLTIA